MKGRIAAAGTLSAVALVAALVIVVLRFGIEDPSPPLLRDAPITAIPGEIVYAADDRCVIAVSASGEGTARRFCASLFEPFGDLLWVDERTVAVRSGAAFRAYDLEAQQEVAAPQGLTGFVSSQGVSPAGDMASIAEDGRLIVTSRGTESEAADFDIKNWRARVITWSPDSQWILLGYTPPRKDRMELWIVSRDGLVQGTLAEDTWPSGMASWRIGGVGVTPQLTAEPAPGTPVKPVR